MLLEPGPISLPGSFGRFMLAYRRAPGLIGLHVSTMFGAAGAEVADWDVGAEEVIGAHQRALNRYVTFHVAKFHASPNPFITFWSPYTSKRLVRLYDRAYNRAHKLMLPKRGAVHRGTGGGNRGASSAAGERRDGLR